MKRRLDVFLYQEGYYTSRSMARAAVMEGLVSVDGSNDVKPGTQVDGGRVIQITPREKEYVSRGGYKLEKALEDFGVDPRGRKALDIGASTGGFTDCLLSRGASAVVALDVGKGQLHWKLRNDPRVVVMERYNARRLKREDLPFSPTLTTADVSFISLTMVMMPAFEASSPQMEMVALVKPQFEANRSQVGRRGVVSDPTVHREVLGSMNEWILRNGLVMRNVTHSPVRGPKGNIEFLIHVVRGAEGGVSSTELDRAVARAHRKT